jgi:hypothetical protein
MMPLPSDLARLAQEYVDQLRSANDNRSALVLERILDLIRRHKGDVTPAALTEYLKSRDPGMRIVGATLTTVHPHYLLAQPLLDVAQEPLSDFEQYHIMQALQAIAKAKDLSPQHCLAVRAYLLVCLEAKQLPASIQALAHETLSALKCGTADPSGGGTQTKPQLVEHFEREPLRIFLCHSSEDKSIVRELYDKLRQDGYSPWLDQEDLLPGQSWEAEIRRAVRNADAILICLSKTSTTKSGFNQKEIRFALDVADEQPEGTILLIPAKLEECEVPERLRQIQWVDLFAPSGYQRLVRSLLAIANAKTVRNV